MTEAAAVWASIPLRPQVLLEERSYEAFDFWLVVYLRSAPQYQTFSRLCWSWKFRVGHRAGQLAGPVCFPGNSSIKGEGRLAAVYYDDEGRGCGDNQPVTAAI